MSHAAPAPPRSTSSPSTRVAIVHEWLDTFGGSERVLEQILREFPSPTLHAVVDFMPSPDRAFLGDTEVRTSFIQRLPGARRRFRSYLPLMPIAVEQLDMSGFDLVVSSSHAVAKGVITGPDQLHVSYVHSPMRYAWDLQHQYLRESGLERGPRSWLARSALHYLRGWDTRTANGVDAFLANSEFIARRIRKAYRRDARVVYPPVDVERFTPAGSKESFYLTTSRLVPYKRTDVIVEAFRDMPERKLVVVGGGPEMRRLERLATGNVELLGAQPFERVLDLTRRARGFVFASLEDFGIAPVEAQACGTPVIAYGRGGALETVRGLDDPSPTGVFFYSQTPRAVREAVEAFEAQEGRFDPAVARASARRFSVDAFRGNFRSALASAWEAFDK